MNSNALLAAVAAATAALDSVDLSPQMCGDLDDAALLELSGSASHLRQLVEARVALVAGEIGRRSARELGSQGLAQRLGLRTAEELVRVTNRSTAREASASVRVGRIIEGADEPWLATVSNSVLDGTLPAASAEAIRAGLGRPSSGVSETVLAAAAARLCVDSAAIDPDRLQRRARELRDELDESGVVDREAARRAQRSLRFTTLADGMSRAVWVMDPETSALFGNLYDRATSPRRGGPRFVDDTAASKAEVIVADERSTEQLASDVFLELLRHGADADSSELLGSGGASITLHVTDVALVSGTGHGFIEGRSDPVSIETVQRVTCSGGVTEVTFGVDGQPLDVGREQRLFTRRQRRALAARDGGCMAPGCDRPPSWTEAHHIKHWARDGGRTDIADGILLCRHHHLLFHNNGWEIDRRVSAYWLIPPDDVDETQTPIRLEPKNPLRRRRAA